MRCRRCALRCENCCPSGRSCGYRLDGSARFGFCTDLGTVTDAVRAALCGVDCAVIEANHDPELLRTGPYPIYLKRRIASDRLGQPAAKHRLSV